MLARVNAAGDRVFTSSSCSGRVAVFVGPDFFDKRGSAMVWHTHDPRECRSSLCSAAEIYSLLAYSGRVAWASLQPPVIQLYARDEAAARDALRCAKDSGFARAGAWWSGEGWLVVEAAVRDKIHVALPAPCSLLSRLCEALERYKARVYRLLECLESVNGRGLEPEHPAGHRE